MLKFLREGAGRLRVKAREWDRRSEEWLNTRAMNCEFVGRKVNWRPDEEGVMRCREISCPEQNEMDVGGVPIRRGERLTAAGIMRVERCDSARHRGEVPAEGEGPVIGTSNKGLEFYR